MTKLFAVLIAACTATALTAQSFEDPVRFMDGDEAINVDIGHAAPFYYDIDGDGVRDLLVGQFGEGKLRIYKNHGTDAKPEFKGFEWLKANGDIARVPTG